jgi:hypothetical protein
MLDHLAVRYNRLPSEVADLDGADLDFNLAVMKAGVEEQIRQAKKHSRER